MNRKKAEAMEELVMEEGKEKVRKNAKTKEKEYKSKSNAEGRYDDVRDLYAEDLF